jgi:hypothetical protein
MKPPGKGHKQPRKLKLGLVCYFDPDQFDEIRTRATKHGTSFSEQVRLLVEWGFEAENTQ